MDEKQKLVIKNSVLILNSAEQLQAESNRMNDGLAHELNCILMEIMHPDPSARPSPIVVPESRKDKTRKLFRRAKGQRPLKRSEMHKSLSEIELEIKSASSSKKPWIKKLYRKIMLKTHPDILSADLSEADRLHFENLSRKAAEAYHNENEISIIKIGVELEIYGDLDFDVQKSMILEEYNKVQESILKLQQSISWKWGFGCRDLQDKIRFLKAVCEGKNATCPSDDEMQNIIKKYSN